MKQTGDLEHVLVAFLFVLLVVLWGSNFLLVKVLIEEMPPIAAVSSRVVIGAATAISVLYLKKGSTPTLSRRMLALSVSINVVPFVLNTWALEAAASGTVSVLNATAPLFTASLSAVLLREAMTRRRVVGLLVGIVGVALIFGLNPADIRLAESGAYAAVLLAAGSFAVGGLWGMRLLNEHDPIELTASQLLIGSAILGPPSLLAAGLPHAWPNAEVILALMITGVGVTGLASIIYLALIRRIGAVRSSLITYVAPAVALFLGWAILEEELTLLTIVGSVLIIGGAAAVVVDRAKVISPASAVPPLSPKR